MESPPISLVGIKESDRLKWSEYVKVDGTFVKHWIWDRFQEIPDGALVKVSVEVLDDRP